MSGARTGQARSSIGERMRAANAAIAGVLDWLLGLGARSAPMRCGVIGLIALLVVLPGIATLPVTDRDEARFAQASKQMLETGDLIDIRFQDQPRWKKPVGIYWLQAGVAWTAGGAEAPIWAYRVPSAVGIVLAALLTGWAALPIIGARGATLAGVMLATALLAVSEANIAKTDAMLAASATAVMGALLKALVGAAGAWTWAVFWLALAAAILLKGPIVPAIAVLTVVAVWIATRERPALAALRPLPGLALIALLVAPWLVAIWVVSDGAFFAESVGKDLLGKVAEGQEKHWGPPGLYTLLVWGTFWPWAALLPLAAGWAWAARRTRWVLVLAAWVLPFWLVLEAVPTKLPHYVLPLYPALSILLAAWVMADDQAQASQTLRRVAAGLVAIPGIVLAVALIALPLVVEGHLVWPAIPLALAGGAAAVLAARAALDGARLAQCAASVIAAMALSAGVLQFGLPALTTAFPSPRMAALAAQWQPCASGPLMTLGYREPSLVFLNGTDTRLWDRIALAQAFETDLGTMALVEKRWRKDLDVSWSGTPPTLVERASLTYFNYNRGKSETAFLLTRDDPRWDACSN